MRAIHIKCQSQAVILERPRPTVLDGQILVQPIAVAIQPSDWKHVDFIFVGDPAGVRLGFEYAGNVVEVGANTKCDFKVGDRVFGLCHAANVARKDEGTFAEYAVVRPEFQMRMPNHLTYEEASAISSGLIPVCQGLYQDLRLPLPTCPSSSRKIPLLIYGGSTTSGMMGIQFSKMSGCTVIATCSPRNFDLLTSLGADYCVDYNSPTCLDDIKTALGAGGAPLRHAWDCIATTTSAQICAQAMSPRGGHYSSLLFLSSAILRRVNPRIRCSTTIGYTVFGEEFRKETVIERREEDHEFWMRFWRMSEKLLQQKRFKPPPVFVNVGCEGLEGILYGIDYLKQGRVSGGKLVYNSLSPPWTAGNVKTAEPPRPVPGSIDHDGASPEAAQDRSGGRDSREAATATGPPFSECDTTQAIEATKRLTDEIVAQNQFSGYFANAHPDQEKLCVALITQALSQLHCDLGSAEEGEVMGRITAAAGAQRQLDYCYGLLIRKGLLRAQGDSDGLVRTGLPLPGQGPDQILRELVDKYPAFSSVSRLVRHTGHNLADIWTGKTDGVRVVFGTAQGRQLLEDVYGVDKTSLAFHALLGDFLSRLLGGASMSLSAASASPRLGILEVGAGTGGTARWLAPMLKRFSEEAHGMGMGAPQAGSITYTFTDLAPGLVSQATRRFQGEFPLMRFRAYDMETAPPADLAATQDMVVAVNAVHAASDMVQALGNLRAFLRPGGVALVLELQEHACWADFIFGFFAGWWRFSDGRTHATAGPDVWQDAFQRAGFRRVDWTDGTTRDSRFQRLFLGIT